MASSILPRVSLRIALVTALSCATSIFSQTPAPAPAPTPSPAPGGTTGGGGMPSPGSSRPTPQQRPTQSEPNMDFEQARPIFLSGKVVLDDGSRPPVGVLIERICGPMIRPEGYTDTKGNFSFQLGQNAHMMMDASNSSSASSISPTGRGGMTNSMGGMIGSELNGCEVRAVLPGFRSDVVMLAGRRAMDNPDVGTLILHRLTKVEGFTFSGTSLNAPKDATKAYEKGSQAAKKKNWKDAELQLRKAVDMYPKYAVAWYELGTVYHQQNNIDQAKEAYANAGKADEKYLSPFAQLARIEGVQQKWPEVAELTAKVIKLNPYFSADMYYISAVANFNLKKLDVAEEHVREAMKMDPQQKIARMNHLLAVLLTQKQAYPEAAENMRAFLKKVPEGPDAENVKKQLAEVEKRIGASAAAQGTHAAQ